MCIVRWTAFFKIDGVPSTTTVFLIKAKVCEQTDDLFPNQLSLYKTGNPVPLVNNVTLQMAGIRADEELEMVVDTNIMGEFLGARSAGVDILAPLTAGFDTVTQDEAIDGEEQGFVGTMLSGF